MRSSASVFLRRVKGFLDEEQERVPGESAGT